MCTYVYMHTCVDTWKLATTIVPPMSTNIGVKSCRLCPVGLNKPSHARKYLPSSHTIRGPRDFKVPYEWFNGRYDKQ